jgi:hypothetical protein
MPAALNVRIATAALSIASTHAWTIETLVLGDHRTSYGRRRVRMRIERELTMSYRTILSLAATAILTTAGMSIVSTDALARAGARVGMNHARVGAVAHRGVYRGAYTNRGIYRGAYARPGVAVGVGAAALGAAAAASAYNYNSGYAPTYYGDTGYYQQPYGYQPWSGSGSSSYPYTSPWWAR